MLYQIELFRWLSEADESLLLAANGCHTPFLDSLMWTLSDKLVWVPFYLLLAAFVFRRLGWKRGIVCMAVIALMVTAADQACSSLIRPAVERLRPSSPDNPLSCAVQLVNGYRGGHYGFPSCHAANTFALALFLSLLFRNRRATVGLIGWSLLVSYSRIYLGVHYPGDIIGGIAVGAVAALMSYRLMNMVFSLPRLRLKVQNL